MKRLLILLGICCSGVCLAQKTCTSNPTTISSNINFGAITWTATGGATVTECDNMADGLITFVGNVVVDLANSRTITISNNVNITGNFPISGGPGSTLSINGGGASTTLHVTGNLGDAASNGVQYQVVASTDHIQVDGTLFGKNNNAFTGAGTISGGTLDVKNGSTCGAPCPVSGGFTTCTSGDAFCTTYSVLPINLISFSANPSKASVKLNWATASELNFDYFDVERSSDASDFMSIGTVAGHGTSNVRNDYGLIDEKPLIGKNYYRLKSVDFDNYIEYFKVLAVDFSGEKKFVISPNPSDGVSLGFSLNFTPDVNSTIIVYDNLGNIIGVYRPSDFSQNISFTNSLKTGIYYAKIISDDFVKVERFVVR